jgi:uncharacterized protein
MTTFLMMLPLYLFGNLHCMGMCGPLVMMIGKHRCKNWYFLGRTLSFSLAAAAAGALGTVLNIFLARYNIAALVSVIFGIIILAAGIFSLLRLPMPNLKLLGGVEKTLSLLILKDQKLPTFLFGFFTVFLPCGQTLIVFSACALSASALAGLFNGFMFAILTSPSLFFAMQAHRLLGTMKKHYNTLMGAGAIAVGLLACFRGLADLNVISHFILNPGSPSHYHIVLY